MATKDEYLIVRSTPEVKERIRRFQGRLQQTQGRRITMREAIEVALASAEAAHVSAEAAAEAANEDLLRVFDQPGVSREVCLSGAREVLLTALHAIETTRQPAAAPFSVAPKARKSPKVRMKPHERT